MPTQAATQEFKVEKLGNGISLIVEEMPWASSAAVSIFMPFGAATDPAGKEGSSSLLCELMQKGAGDFSSKELSEQFDSMGAHRSHSVGVSASVFSGIMLPEYLDRTLGLLATQIRQPNLPEEEFRAVQSIALQELAALEDEPASKVMVELNKQYYPAPFNRSQLGTTEGVKAISVESLRSYYSERLVAGGAIIGIAGKVSAAEVSRSVKKYFGTWSGEVEIPTPGALPNKNNCIHLERDTAQLQIALAFPSVEYSSSDYYAARVATSVLSGGMFGRLFVEVREKRGLVYRVAASQNASKGRASLTAYAGTTPQNGQECLDVVLQELKGLVDGVPKEELDRAKADLKSRLVMGSELSGNRAASLVHDFWNLGRVRKVEEIKSSINAVTSEEIATYASAYPPDPITLVCLGPKALELPS